MTEDIVNSEDLDKDLRYEIMEKVGAKSLLKCIQCGVCSGGCTASDYIDPPPHRVVASLLLGLKDRILSSNALWTCLTCGRCTIYCPMTGDELGVNIAKIIMELRSLFSDNKPLQEKLIEFHHDREYSSLPYLMANDKIKFANKLAFLEGTDLKTTDKGEIAYFMGCVPFLTGTAPCVVGCPAEVDVQGYISLIAEGKFQEALDLIREMNPLPYLCGRICTAQCALNCNRQFIEDPIEIRELKRFLTDWEVENKSESQIKPVEQSKEKVAIIGSGPGGLSAAYFLARMGYKPTIFEKGDKVGGMVRYGVPQYRLSDEALDRDIDFIKSMGVEIILNKPFGSDFTLRDLKKGGFEAVFIAVGLYIPITLNLEGGDLPNVNVALDFLTDRKYNYVNNPEEFKDKSFGIIGGGAVAVDVSETAIRLGAKKVDLVDILSEEALKNVLKDIHSTEMELMEYHFETSTVKITQESDGKLALNCYKIEWGEPDPKTGRRPFNKVEGSELKIVVDNVVIAIGQSLDLEPINIATGNNLKIERGKILVDELTHETGIPAVFAGGDIIYNSLLCAVDAIGDGREAAISIDRLLRGIDLKEGRIRKKDLKRSPIPKKQIETQSGIEMSFMPGEKRLSCFDEMELGFSKEEAIEEATRCLNCNSCSSYDQILEDYNALCDPSGTMICHYGDQPSINSLNAIDYLKIPKNVIGLLNLNDIVPVILSDEKCCGHDSSCKGDLNTLEKLAKYNVKLFKDAGVKTIVFSCAEGYYTWKNEYEKFFEGTDDFEFEVYHITEYILKEGLLDNINFPPLEEIKVTYHDPCRLGRMSNVYDAPREVINKIPGLKLIEMENIKGDADCCGVSAYISCDGNSKELQGKRIEEAINTGADYIITTCPKCLAHFSCYLNEHKELKSKINVIDLLSLIGKVLNLLSKKQD